VLWVAWEKRLRTTLHATASSRGCHIARSQFKTKRKGWLNYVRKHCGDDRESICPLGVDGGQLSTTADDSSTFHAGLYRLRKVHRAREAFDLTEYLALLGLLILAFTTFWSFYYSRLPRKIRNPELRPSRQSLEGKLLVGLWASSLGIALSLITLFIEVSRLLILFLKPPQGGVPIIRTETDTRSDWVSAIDAVSLLAEVCTVAGEFLLLGLTLWLLFRVTRLSAEYSEISTH
jgi:uncharacterized membrane protein